MDDLQKKLKELEERIAKLETRRLLQQDFLPSCVKNRAMGEANSYIYNINSSNLPTSGTTPVIGTSIFYEEDTKKIKIWNSVNKEWDETTLT
jgi:hypothetical protein